MCAVFADDIWYGREPFGLLVWSTTYQHWVIGCYFIMYTKYSEIMMNKCAFASC